MFEHLAPFKRIIVTGPHRSGTTICARMIAADTGKVFVMERKLGMLRFQGDTEPALERDTVLEWLAAREDVVLQGATCFTWIDEIHSAFRPDIAVVFVVRSPEDIAASQVAYRGYQIDDPVRKEAEFRRRMKHLDTVWMVEYDALRGHPMFVEDRTGWAPRQTEPAPVG